MKTTPAHKGAGTDERPRPRALFRASYSNAEPNELYSRSRDFSIVVEDDLGELLVDGDRVAELVGQLVVVVDREPRRCGGGAVAVAEQAVQGGSRGLPLTRPAKPHPEGTSTSSCGGGCGGRLRYRTLHYANARVRTPTDHGLSVSIPISGVSA